MLISFHNGQLTKMMASNLNIDRALIQIFLYSIMFLVDYGR